MAPTAPALDYADDPWNTPDLHKSHDHATEENPRNSIEEPLRGSPAVNGNDTYDNIVPPSRTTSTFTTTSVASAGESANASTESTFIAASLPGGGWGGGDFFGDNAAGGEGNPDVISPFGAPGGSIGGPGHQRPISSRTIGTGRPGSGVEEHIIVNLLPEKEGMFMFQHHNYEVVSARRGSKVIRRYSDFVWLLDCMHKRYPFRALPLLPPKRVAGTSQYSLPMKV